MLDIRIPFSQVYKELRMDYTALDNLLANMAEVTPVAVYKMRRGDPVRRWQAEAVLRIVEMILGPLYTLDTVAVALYPD